MKELLHPAPAAFAFNPTQAEGSQAIQLFTLINEFNEYDGLTFNNHPLIDQYYGTYLVAAGGDSTPLDVSSFPCDFGNRMQFLMRPQDLDDYVSWTQNTGANVGAFIEMSN